MSWNNESPDDIANELAGYQEAFDAAPMPDGGAVGGKVPDGDYQATIKRVDVTRSKKGKSSGKLIIRWRLKVVGPLCAGAELTKWNGFDTDDKLKRLKEDLSIVGIPPTGLNLAKLEAQLLELDGRMVEVSVETDGQYQNVSLKSASPRDTPF